MTSETELCKYCYEAQYHHAITKKGRKCLWQPTSFKLMKCVYCDAGFYRKDSTFIHVYKNVEFWIHPACVSGFTRIYGLDWATKPSVIIERIANRRSNSWWRQHGTK